MGRKLLASDGSFPDLSSATTLACRLSLGIFLLSLQLSKKRSSQFRDFLPHVFDELRLDVVQAGCFTIIQRSNTRRRVRLL